MIKPDLSYTTSLEQFYNEIVRLQQASHGQEYTAHHRALKQCVAECKTIKELGVCQGATLAGLLLSKPRKLTGIDIDDRYFNPYKHLFVEYAQANSVDFEFIKGSSIDPSLVTSVDLLHIDSYHIYDHLLKELITHAPSVNKYIVFHDTRHAKAAPGLLKAIAHYITEVEQTWQIVDHYILNAGYTVIKRV